jgi:hypothetical protein
VQSFRERMSSWDREPLASPGELALASRVSGVLWLSGAVTLLLTLALPGSMIDALWVVAVIAAFAVVWGVLMLSPVPWVDRPVRLSHISTVVSLGIVAVLARVSGGAGSPAIDLGQRLPGRLEERRVDDDEPQVTTAPCASA